MLDAGIDVFSTVNVQHLESLNDQVAQLTGARVRETIPDEVLSAADEVVLIDLTPEALIARLRAGKVYRPERVPAALNNFFKIENLRRCARRRCARWPRTSRSSASCASRARVGAPRRGGAHRAQPEPGPQAIAERLLALVTLAPHSERVVRRAWRSAQRLDAELDVLVVRPPGRPPSARGPQAPGGAAAAGLDAGRAAARRGGRGRGGGRDRASRASSARTYVLMGTPAPRRGLGAPGRLARSVAAGAPAARAARAWTSASSPIPRLRAAGRTGVREIAAAGLRRSGRRRCDRGRCAAGARPTRTVGARRPAPNASKVLADPATMTRHLSELHENPPPPRARARRSRVLAALLAVPSAVGPRPRRSVHASARALTPPPPT